MRYFLWSVWTDQRGIVLVMALILMALLSALAAGYSTLMRADTALRGAAGRERQGFYAAEAGLNFSMAEVRDDFNNYTPPAAYSHSINVDSGAHERTVTYNVAPVAGHDPSPPTVIPAGQPFAGLYTIPSDFTVTSTSENSEGDTEAILGAQFTINSVPIFQFLAFYSNTLEILPGAQMNLTGRIHTNGDLYLNGLLAIGDLPSPPNPAPGNPFVHVSAAKNVYRGRLNTTVCDGAVSVDMLQDKVAPLGDLDPRTLSCVGGASAKVPTATIAAYLGSLLSGVTPLQVPPVDTIARGGGSADGGVFWEHADLRIVLRANLSDKAVVHFGSANLCPGDANIPPAIDSPSLYPIEVQDAGGGRDDAKTTQLWKFMCQRRGAIFYNDLPTNLPAPTAAMNNPNPAGASDPSNPVNYNPRFSVATDPAAAERVYRRAGEDTNGDGVITNKDRNDDVCPVSTAGATAASRPWWALVSLCPYWPNPSNQLPLTSWFLDTDYRRGGFYNRREKKWVLMLNVNIRALIDWNEANGAVLFPLAGNGDNGGPVFFLSVQANDSTTTPPPSDHRYGVRIIDSANLNTRGGTFPWPAPTDPTGLTVVSDQAIYIEGNYNFVHKYPAAVIGDTLNVLSQTWEVPSVVANPGGRAAAQRNNDRKSATDMASTGRDLLASDGYYVPNATPFPAPYNAAPSGPSNGVLHCGGATGVCAATNNFNNATSFGINAAFIANVDITTPGGGDAGYNGGLENYPRFHENWNPSGGQRTLIYRGSFVSLDKPQYTGPQPNWCGTGNTCNVYNPPIRNWDYDVDFNDVKKLPPLTPMINMIQQRVYTRFYK